MISTVVKISVSELCEREELSRSLLVQLVQYEIARPVAGSTVDDWIFDVTSAHWMTRAVRLRRDLDIDWVAVAMLIDLLRERDRLSQENEYLQQRLGRFMNDEDRGPN
ncbi:chaperone modulator CbpM [Pseudohalioglobus lutimaris]|uniref:Chaperone modulatory protein CbpM n=1 Tax=Pseudohalioglobus lutimaris TaxID=1737061 RepID=A0A2N5X809_9GAMM|nr:chaperone modulator CbpM [Pseudohalioglobus lutimaris]PLW70608.1 chaperone modulatory protein CbpM [Pseudohalioglobus lutimaris]